MNEAMWQEVRQRLSRAEAKLNATLNRSHEENSRLMAERARSLAMPLTQQQSERETIHLVEFRLAEETYALEGRFISEVYPLHTFTSIPGTPPFVLGIINIRGHIYSIIDLKVFFELPSKGLNDLTRVIILHNEDMAFGILAEEVLGARDLFTHQIQPPLPTLTGIRNEYLRGIAEDRLIVLDAEKLLTSANIVVNQGEDAGE